MNGVFNTGLSFWQFVGLFVLTVISIIAIRITFDLNKFLERRDKKLQQKLKNACSHMTMELVGQENGLPVYRCQSLFESPPGVFQWQCQRCGLVRNHNNDHKQMAEHYAKNPDEYLKKQRKFQKLLKKAGLV